ncbi:hypothetical protein DFA_09467 [Cavenderia fasciculata]|uniref:Transmembrane protein n=1 Tax=Cavenderia fasciculata TaxID=261658 RepID=F4Q7P9_CACFS|nr:uncharacterized protein DFA_09467 [Cavenderia fasciculata]EGG15799.1 hypothetical protein DFA_09467 [Cavenderia fasciculata]|eukprot:XP_004352124.1 hypothetical protein DFA_09467 [Cavenderia fasciculata]
MNSPKSVVWGFVAFTIAGMSAWAISRKEYMNEKNKRINDIIQPKNKKINNNNNNNNQNNNNNNTGGPSEYRAYQETKGGSDA